ncbi:MAG: hypothetical protein ABIE94_02740 [archaeon]
MVGFERVTVTADAVRNTSRLSLTELRAVKGIGMVKAIQIKAMC